MLRIMLITLAIASVNCAELEIAKGDVKITVKLTDWPMEVKMTPEKVRIAALELMIKRQDMVKDIDAQLIELRTMKMMIERDLYNIKSSITGIMEDNEKYAEIHKEKNAGLIEFAKLIEVSKEKFEKLEKIVTAQERELKDKKNAILDESALLGAVSSDK